MLVGFAMFRRVYFANEIFLIFSKLSFIRCFIYRTHPLSGADRHYNLWTCMSVKTQKPIAVCSV